MKLSHTAIFLLLFLALQIKAQTRGQPEFIITPEKSESAIASGYSEVVQFLEHLGAFVKTRTTTSLFNIRI